MELAFNASSLLGIVACTLLLWRAAKLQSPAGTSSAAFWSAFLLSAAIVWFCGGWPLDVFEKLQIVAGRVPLPRDFHYVGRFPHIEFTLLVLVAWWTALVKVATDGKATSAALLGLTLAAAQYSYFYYWTACGVATFFALVVFSRPKNALRVYLVAGVVYIALAPPGVASRNGIRTNGARARLPHARGDGVHQAAHDDFPPLPRRSLR